MKISVKSKSHNMPLIKDSIVAGGREVPEYLTVDPTKFLEQVTAAPHLDQIPLPLPINVPLICEFLAHTN